MNKVYIVKRTDGEYINIDKVFLILNKAKLHKEKLIKEDIEYHGFQWEDYYIDEYEVIK